MLFVYVSTSKTPTSAAEIALVTPAAKRLIEVAPSVRKLIDASVDHVSPRAFRAEGEMQLHNCGAGPDKHGFMDVTALDDPYS